MYALSPQMLRSITEAQFAACAEVWDSPGRCYEKAIGWSILYEQNEASMVEQSEHK